VAKLPRPSGREMVRFLEKQGFKVVRVRGGHHVMERGNQHTSVPVHGNRPLKIGTLRSILRDIDMDADQFTDLWNA
jgi:predicted RNA binding protein YcfA (HicA-like mRNA interferase family)